MKHVVALAIAACVLLSCVGTPQGGTPAAASLSTERLKLVRAACFEVVTEKPSKDSLSYSKPLNWDLQDYTVRNDRYIPLGTAFAISANELVTAAHVFELTPRSLVYTTRFIREKVRDGGKTTERVYEVESIRAFSSNRDYVVFTVKGRKFDSWLRIQDSFQFNTAVYAAGDAYGEGIVVREGTLLDDVPEPENGAWNYLKSSIATNPGSSGGPLLDRNGEVIGIVLSRKDDFCYSLPMKEMALGKAVYHKKFNLGFAAFNKRQATTMDAAWDIPLPYPALADNYLTAFHAFYFDGMDKLFAENREDLFPAGPSSDEALFTYVDGTFPQIYLQNSTNGSWYETNLQLGTTNIDNSGSVSYAEIYKDARVWLLRLVRPRDRPVRELWDNPKEAMDLVLKGINITRKLTPGDEGARITSYGTPVQTVAFTDRFDRRWKLNVYFLEYSDQLVMTCTTPTPQGLCMIYVASESGDLDWWLYDMKKLADFMNVSYGGTLEEWDTYLKQEEFRFGAMKQVSVAYREGAYADIDTPSVSTRVREGLTSINGSSDLYLVCDVFTRDGKPVWDIRKILVDSGGASSDNYLTFYRWTAPTDALPQPMKDDWKKSVIEHGHPYNGKVYSESGRTNLGMLHPAFLQGDRAVVPNDFAYTIFGSKEGNVSEDEMKNYLQLFARETHIKK